MFTVRYLWLCILPTELDVFQKSIGYNVSKFWCHSTYCWSLWLFSRCTFFYHAILLQFGINSCAITNPWRSLFNEVIFFNWVISKWNCLIFCKFYGENIRLRSFLCGITLAIRYFIAAISTKLYYIVEVWLTLPGTILFYGIISLIGYVKCQQ